MDEKQMNYFWKAFQMIFYENLEDTKMRWVIEEGMYSSIG